MCINGWNAYEAYCIECETMPGLFTTLLLTSFPLPLPPPVKSSTLQYNILWSLIKSNAPSTPEWNQELLEWHSILPKHQYIANPKNKASYMYIYGLIHAGIITVKAVIVFANVVTWSLYCLSSPKCEWGHGGMLGDKVATAIWEGLSRTDSWWNSLMPTVKVAPS